jgi:DNA-binding NarL/FixJ family response regulator
VPRARAERTVIVEVAIDDDALADHIGDMLLTLAGLRTANAEDGSVAEVRITDGADPAKPGIAVIVITDRTGAIEALRVGAIGILPAHTRGRELHAAIRAAAEGLTTIAADFRDLVAAPAEVSGELAGDADIDPVDINLTPRELQVLHLLVQGASNKIIARELEITPHTAKFHVASIVAKLGAAGRTDAVAKAMRLGLVMI